MLHAGYFFHRLADSIAVLTFRLLHDQQPSVPGDLLSMRREAMVWQHDCDGLTQASLCLNCLMGAHSDCEMGATDTSLHLEVVW